MKTMFWGMALWGVCGVISGTPALAQETAGAPAVVNAQAAMAMEEDRFSFGKVVSVSGDQITVSEYDFVKDADVEAVYMVTPETELGNVASVSALAAGDDIVIDYAEKDGKRVVTTLVKEEKGMEETMPEGDVYAPAPADEGNAMMPETANTQM